MRHHLYFEHARVRHLPFGFVGQSIAYPVGCFRKILVDDALNLLIRFETRWDDVGVGDGLEQQPQESRVLSVGRQAHTQRKGQWKEDFSAAGAARTPM